jgi:predicted metal-dependent phosphoesterase TrpH
VAADAPAARPDFDLQAHSTHSDGALAPGAVVARAAAAGVTLLALSDHHAVDGVDEALDAAERAGIALVPAVEISAPDAAHPDIHVLGYGVDHRDGALRDRLAAYRADRDARAERMADRLEALGFAVDRAALAARRAQGRPVGRPHVAAAVVAHPANAARLREQGLDDASAFLAAYLVEGAPAFAPRTMPSVADAIAAVHDAGGVAVWAHPFWDLDERDAVLAALDRYVAAGLDGVEAFYVTHDAEQTALLADRAEALGLLTTGSSDFHGPEHPRFGAFRAFGLHGRTPRLGPIDVRRAG